MSKYKIECMSYLKEPNGEIMRQWEVTIDSKLWPCCHFVVEDVPKEDSDLLKDDILQLTNHNDPNWNSLEHYTLPEIIESDFYQTYCHPKGWASDNPPYICVKKCNKAKKQDRTQFETDSGKNVTNILQNNKGTKQ